jgi:tetratricopeptide (TPR) repeat protein
MLRDLDSRQYEQKPSVISAPAGPTFAKARPTSGRLITTVVLGSAVALGALAWAWLQYGAAEAPAIVDPTPSVTVAAALPAASNAVADTAAAKPDGVAVTGAMVLRMEESLSARRALDALLSTPATVSAPALVPALPSASAPTTIAPAPTNLPDRTKPRAMVAAPGLAVAPTAAPAKAGIGNVQADSAPAVQRQLQAGGDALAQAQNLWNSGSRDAAFDLMQQSIAAAERAAKASPSSNSAAVLVALAREMARMQLAEGRYGAVWEMLTRLESQLGNHADLWAIRANAAQRLGRHQDSVHAYMVALQSRPDEQRWLLGTAVSLAALGQTSSATEMAEKARTIGPVSKDILAYLRQAGVTIRD